MEVLFRTIYIIVIITILGMFFVYWLDATAFEACALASLSYLVADSIVHRRNE